jgi:hypothetical protein
MAHTGTCATCAYFSEEDNECRRRCPPLGGWPVTDEDGWCGEWEPHYAVELRLRTRDAGFGDK